MPLPVRRKSRRLRPWRWAASVLSASARCSYSCCEADCGGGTNSSFDAIRAGIGSAWSFVASSSHCRTHISKLLRDVGSGEEPDKSAIPLFQLAAVRVILWRTVFLCQDWKEIKG